MVRMNKILNSITFFAIFPGILLLYGNSAIAGEHTIPVSIGWSTPVKNVLPDGTIFQYAHFTGAVYTDFYGNLPVYYQRFAGNDLIRYQFEISGLVAQPLSPEEAGLVEFQHLLIGNEVHFTQIPEIERREKFTGLYVLPYIKDATDGKILKLLSFDLIVKEKALEPAASVKSSEIYPSSSVLADGDWFKIALEKDGIYRLSYEDLASMGMNMNTTTPSNIRVFGNGGIMLPEENGKSRYTDPQEIPVQVHDNNDGSFDPGDYILFYGQGTTSWEFIPLKLAYDATENLYSRYSYYFVTAGAEDGKRLTLTPSVPEEPTLTVRDFIDFRNYQPRQFSLAKTGKDWYGADFTDTVEREFVFDFPNLDTNLFANITSQVAAKSTSGSKFIYYVNGDSVMSISVSPLPPGANLILANTSSKNARFGIKGGNPVTVKVKFTKPVDDSKGWLNYINLNVMRKLIYTGDQLIFRNFYAEGAGTITQYEMAGVNPDVSIWDITDPFNTTEISSNITGSELKFRLATDSVKTFAAFDPANYLVPEFIDKVPNQNLHAYSNCDMIIVAPEEFHTQAMRIKTLHDTTDMISSVVVSPREIYNEFSSGKQDPAAIRNFARMIYLRSDPPQLKYILLMGDGSYDPLDRLPGNTRLIPAYQSSESLKLTSSFASDDFYGLMDEGEGPNALGTLDLGVGRYPVKTPEEAEIVVNKQISYVQAIKNQPGNWRNWICLTADDEDNNLHFYQADTVLAKLVDLQYPAINVKKIYLDSYKQVVVSGGNRYPEANSDINKNISEGVLIMNYTGHGGELGWAYENIVTVQDILNWKNTGRLPVFITATCEFTRYDNPAVVSAGELVLLNPSGGGVALFSTTRLAFAQDNIILNKRIYQKMFKPVDGIFPRLGDLIKASKTPSSSNMRNFTLFGDPALTMAYPGLSTVTSFINRKPAGLVPDTIRAGQTVTVSGYVTDAGGQIMNDFNGILYPSVFDKPKSIMTLGNDPTSQPVPFQLQNDMVWSGEATITNGEFTFSFIVPKDISYNYGPGKISYYAHSAHAEATGFSRDIIIGGIDAQANADQTGPEVVMYLNDPTFVNGQKVNPNPVLYIQVSDESGINSSGNGIGHDITLVFNGDEASMMNLNRQFKPVRDSFKEGRITLDLADLPLGEHELIFRVWDNMNNSSQVMLNFEISNNLEVDLTQIRTVPNPFTESTEFRFRHNHFNETLKAEINIYALDGRPVHRITVPSLASNGYLAEPVYWNGNDMNGNRLKPGIYVYDITVAAGNEKFSVRSQKLIIGPHPLQ